MNEAATAPWILDALLSADTVGNAGVALITLLISAIGFFVSSWLTRRNSLKDLRRQKMEEFCRLMQDAATSISDALQNQLLSSSSIKAAASLGGADSIVDSESIAKIDNAINSMNSAYIIKSLYFANNFSKEFHDLLKLEELWAEA